MPGSDAPSLPPSLEGRDLVEALLRALVAGSLPKAELDAAMPAIEGLMPADVVAGVDGLVAETTARGASLESLKPGVARFLNLVHKSLSSRPAAAPADPLFALLLRENRLALEALEALRAPLARISAAGPRAAEREAAVAELGRRVAALSRIELHYSRLENVLFPSFEARHPEYRCLALMWSIHDDVRSALRKIAGLLELGAPEGALLASALGRLFFDVHSLVFREEALLYPVLRPLIPASELVDLYREALALGSGFLGVEEAALLDARAEGFAAGLAAAPDGAGHQSVVGALADGRADGRADGPAPAGAERSAREGAIPLDAGALSPAVLDVLLKSLPLDLSFIDAEGRVAWFSNGPHRVFPRSPAIIGRDVRNCHPHESLGRVNALIEELRTGRRESEAFWIRSGGRFLHIEYFALRDAAGRFLGVLEASEDLTAKRALEGEKRLAAP